MLSAPQRKGGRSPPSIRSRIFAGTLLLRRRLLLVAETGFNRAADRCQYSFGGISVAAGRLQFQIFLKGFGSPRRRLHLAFFGRGSFAHHVDTLPIVGVGAVGISGDDLVEGCQRIVHLTGVCEHGAGVEVVLGGVGGVGLGGSVVGLHGVIDMTGLGVGFRQVVVVSGKVRGSVGIFIVGGALLDIDRFLISLDRGTISFIFLGGI